MDKREINKYFKEEDRKEFAFECNGIKYYQFVESALPITYMRLKAAQETLDLAGRLKVTSEVLNEFLDILEVYAGKRSGDHRITNATKEDIQASLAMQVNIMRQRMSLGSGLEAMYILASIFYFDETEDPAVWDRTYAKEKIKRWQGHHEVEAFFLRSLPLHTIISAELFQVGTPSYFENLYLTMYANSMSNYSMLSDEQKESEVGMNMLLLAESYKSLLSLNDKGLLNIMSTQPTS